MSRRGRLLGYGARLEVGVTQPSRTERITRDVRSQRGSEETDGESSSYTLKRETDMAGKEAQMVHVAGGRSCSKMQDARNAFVSSVRDPAQRRDSTGTSHTLTANSQPRRTRPPNTSSTRAEHVVSSAYAGSGSTDATICSEKAE